MKPEIRRGVVALQLKTYSSVVQAALVIRSDQKMAVKEEGDKKRNPEDIIYEANKGESSQEFQKRFCRNKNKRFRRQSFSQTRIDVTSIASTPT